MAWTRPPVETVAIAGLLIVYCVPALDVTSFVLPSAYRAVTATMRARATTTWANGERFEENRESPFEHFGIGEPRVRHVRLHDARAVEGRSGA